eukprot:1160034-Pelagomonas_calceolata.AAC.8
MAYVSLRETFSQTVRLISLWLVLAITQTWYWSRVLPATLRSGGSRSLLARVLPVPALWWRGLPALLSHRALFSSIEVGSIHCSFFAFFRLLRQQGAREQGFEHA